MKQIICALASFVFAAQADTRQTFTVGTAKASRGQKVYGAIKVPAGSDAGYDIPVALVHGARPGPVLAVVAGSHGSEYASIMAVEDLIARVNPAELSGTLVLVPIVNIASFEKITPHVNPVDNKSMNRFYPGNARGTQTDRASFAVTKEVVEKCDHLIDLHGGDLDENLRPYSYWTVTGNQRQDEISRGMVLAFGLDHIIISRDRPKDPNASRFLENTASTRGKPSFTAEAGRSGPVDPRSEDARRWRDARHGPSEDDQAGGGAGAESRLGRGRLGVGRSRRHVSSRRRSRFARRKGGEAGIGDRLPQSSASGHRLTRGRHRHVRTRAAVAEKGGHDCERRGCAVGTEIVETCPP